MSENNAIRIAKVKYTGDYTLRLQWANEKELTVDLREPVFRLKGLRPLRDTAAFALAGAGEGGHSVVWPGAIDMGAARLLEIDVYKRQQLCLRDFSHGGRGRVHRRRRVGQGPRLCPWEVGRRRDDVAAERGVASGRQGLQPDHFLRG